MAKEIFQDTKLTVPGLFLTYDSMIQLVDLWWKQSSLPIFVGIDDTTLEEAATFSHDCVLLFVQQRYLKNIYILHSKFIWKQKLVKNHEYKSDFDWSSFTNCFGSKRFSEINKREDRVHIIVTFSEVWP